MAAKTTGIYRDLLIHPGETISDVLEERGVSQATLAASTGVSPAFISSVISGKKDISANFAMALEYALGVPKTFWLNLQANYDAELLEASERESITEEERVAYERLSEIVVFLGNGNAIEGSRAVEEGILALRRSLRMSNVANLEKLSPKEAFGLSEERESCPLITGAWVRMCQLANEGTSIRKAYDPKDTAKLTVELKRLMLSHTATNIQRDLQEILAEYGIAFSIARHFKGAPVHGYITKRDNGSYQVSVTIQDTREDAFWFSLFHEIGHIHNGDVNSRKKEYVGLNDNSNQELRADDFAKNTLINPIDYAEFVTTEHISYEAIELFSQEQDVKPCVVIGRLQKDKIIPWSQFDDCKPRLKWA